MDFRRAGLFGQPQHRRSWFRSLWPWTRQLRLRASPELLRSRAELRRPGRLRSDLRRSGCRPDLLRSRPGRAQLLRSRADLLQHGLQQLLQAEEVQEELDGRLQEPLLQSPEVQEEPLLRSGELLRFGPDVRRSGCLRSDVRCSRGPDLRCPGCDLLPLVYSEIPGLIGSSCRNNLL